MKRRRFLSSLAATSGLLLHDSRHIASADQQGSLTSNRNKTILEPAREIPVIEEPDVLVVGGGPAGVTAALSAARAGASTVLVERYNHLGGLWTGGLVLPLLSTHALDQNGKFKQVIFGLGDEIAQRLRGMDMAISEVNPVIDPEAGKYVFDKMIAESGVKVLYHCWASNLIVNDGWIQSVVLESKSGRVAINPKVVIDCTGDGDLLEMAGEEFDNMHYHIGLVHRLGNVDRVDKSKPGYKPIKLGDPTPISSVNWVNMHGEDNQDGIDLYTLSELQQKYRIQVWEKVQKIRSVPGYEDVFLLDTAAQLGVRMSRILRGAYCLTLKDTMTYQAFPDSIGLSGAWTSLIYEGKRVTMRERPLWQIPYRALTPKKTRNLLAAGRCFSFERKLVEDARIIGTCLVTGQGAGVAGAIASQSNSPVHDIDIEKLQAVLKEQKVLLA
ncbi:FAD-dependent oxidoreductase [bacterium]|nr:FAD-dependent oxidoreductase [bacterium]